MPSDLDEFFDLEDGAVSAFYKGKCFPGYFDRDYIETANFSGNAPIFTCITQDFEECGIKEDEVIEINHQKYAVREIEPDGEGVSVLVLSYDT